MAKSPGSTSPQFEPSRMYSRKNLQTRINRKTRRLATAEERLDKTPGPSRTDCHLARKKQRPSSRNLQIEIPFQLSRVPRDLLDALRLQIRCRLCRPDSRPRTRPLP